MERAKKLKAMGWSVASHTAKHKRGLLKDEEDIKQEFYETRRALKEHGLDYDILVYPFGKTSDTIFEVVQRYYKMGINIVRGGSNEPSYLDNYNFQRVTGLSQLVITLNGILYNLLNKNVKILK